MNIYQRILQVYKTVSSVVKDDTVPTGGGSYKAVSHDNVTRALHLPIAEAGIVCIPNVTHCALDRLIKMKPGYNNGPPVESVQHTARLSVTIRFVNAEKPDEFFESSSEALAFDSGDKAIGKAYSMAVKMIYLKVFMLESLDHEEQRDTEDHHPAPPPPAPPRAKAVPPATRPPAGAPAPAIKKPAVVPGTSVPPKPMGSKPAASPEMPKGTDKISFDEQNRLKQRGFASGWVMHEMQDCIKKTTGAKAWSEITKAEAELLSETFGYPPQIWRGVDET